MLSPVEFNFASGIVFKLLKISLIFQTVIFQIVNVVVIMNMNLHVNGAQKDMNIKKMELAVVKQIKTYFYPAFIILVFLSVYVISSNSHTSVVLSGSSMIVLSVLPSCLSDMLYGYTYTIHLSNLNS